MGEKLNKFIAFYTEKATAFVNEKKAKVDEYKAERKNAIDSLKLSVSEKYPTLGDLVKDMFPENGGVNNDLFNGVYSKLSGLTKDDKAKAVISKLNKLSKSQVQYDRANLLLNKGGEKYFNELLDVLKGDASLPFSDIIKDGPAGLEKLLADLDNVPESPPNIESSQELFDSLVENNDATKSTASPKSPINQESSEKNKEASSSGQINNAETTAKQEGGAPSSAITATEAATKSVEPESKVVATPSVINTQKTEEPIVSKETKSPAPPASPVAEKKKEVEVINIGAKEVSQLEKAEAVEKQKQAKIESITEKLKITDETKKENVKDILTRFSESRGKPAPLEGVTTNVPANLSESFGSAKEKAKAIASIGAPSPAINQTTSEASTANFSNIQETSTATTNQTINQSTATASSSSAPTTTTINAPKTLTEKQQSIIDRYKSQMNILTPEEKKMGSELDKSIKVESKAADLSSSEPVVEKNKVEFKEKIQPATAKAEFNTNQNIQNINKPAVQEEKAKSESSIAMTPVAQSTETAEPAASSSSVIQDISAVEKRLKNLEIILSSPLKVIIT